MEKQYIKTGDGKLQVTKTIPEKEVVTIHTLEFLKSQREQILKDMTRIEEELAEVDSLLAEAERLGIQETVEEQPKINI